MHIDSRAAEFFTREVDKDKLLFSLLVKFHAEGESHVMPLVPLMTDEEVDALGDMTSEILDRLIDEDTRSDSES